MRLEQVYIGLHTERQVEQSLTTTDDNAADLARPIRATRPLAALGRGGTP